MRLHRLCAAVAGCAPQPWRGDPRIRMSPWQFKLSGASRPWCPCPEKRRRCCRVCLVQVQLDSRGEAAEDLFRRVRPLQHGYGPVAEHPSRNSPSLQDLYVRVSCIGRNASEQHLDGSFGSLELLKDDAVDHGQAACNSKGKIVPAPLLQHDMQIERCIRLACVGQPIEGQRLAHPANGIA